MHVSINLSSQGLRSAENNNNNLLKPRNCIQFIIYVRFVVKVLLLNSSLFFFCLFSRTLPASAGNIWLWREHCANAKFARWIFSDVSNEFGMVHVMQGLLMFANCRMILPNNWNLNQPEAILNILARQNHRNQLSCTTIDSQFSISLQHSPYYLFSNFQSIFVQLA